MKKNIIATLIATSSIFAINNVLAADGTIEFTGEITDQACELATGSDVFTVNLGKVSKTTLPSTGSTAAATKFTIKLENCPQTVTSATVKFDAISYAGDNNVLQLTDPTANTTAKNVSIQIQDVTGTTVPLFAESSAYALKQNTANNLDFTARYIAMSDAVGVGQANSTKSSCLILSLRLKSKALSASSSINNLLKQSYYYRLNRTTSSTNRLISLYD